MGGEGQLELKARDPLRIIEKPLSDIVEDCLVGESDLKWTPSASHRSDRAFSSTKVFAGVGRMAFYSDGSAPCSAKRFGTDRYRSPVS